jgi:hypothetical protein
MLTIALFTTVKIWALSECPLTDEWVKKTWSMHTVEYYSAIKRTKFYNLAAMLIELEDIMLCEIGQAQKDKHSMSSVVCGSKKFVLKKQQVE